MNFRFSGHETFPCRYAWLPKAFQALASSPAALSDEEEAMIELGVGKNMVRAIRFWVQAAGIAASAPEGGYLPTPLGHAVLAQDGFDPYLEDVRTLWLVHWQIASNHEEPLFAWDFLLNRWQSPEFDRESVLRAFQRETDRLNRPLSKITLDQHFDTFLHTYFPTRGRKGEIREDNLDCPLVELELVRKIGDRPVDGSGRREAIYSFRREEKVEITPELFVYCVDDFWRRRHGQEKTLGFREISVGRGSPGQLFKLPEADVRTRLESIREESEGLFDYRESASLQQLVRLREPAGDLLGRVYAANHEAEARYAHR